MIRMETISRNLLVDTASIVVLVVSSSSKNNVHKSASQMLINQGMDWYAVCPYGNDEQYLRSDRDMQKMDVVK